jgi:drug/metabolite transporter (DMT)-like permease
MDHLVDVVFLREQIGVHRAIGLGFILIGDVLVGGASLLKAFEGGDVWIGDLLFVCASICWAAYSVTVRRFGLDAAKATMAITAFALVSFCTLVHITGVLGHLLPSHFSQASWAEILLQVSFQGVVSVVISGITFNQMIRSYGPVKSTMLTAVVPGLSAFGAAIFLDESISWNL